MTVSSEAGAQAPAQANQTGEIMSFGKLIVGGVIILLSVVWGMANTYTIFNATTVLGTMIGIAFIAFAIKTPEVSSTTPSISVPLSAEARRRRFLLVTLLVITAIAGANSFDDDVFAGLLSVATIAAGAATLHFFAEVNLAERAWQYGWRTVIYVVAYLAIGIAFSLFRWDYHVYDWRQKYDQEKARYERTYSSTDEAGFSASNWRTSGPHLQMMDTMPKFENSKARLTRWVVFWPWSATYFFLSDLVVRGLDWLITQFSGVYDWISLRYTKDLQ